MRALLALVLLCGCATWPEVTPGRSNRVDGIPGPEDVVWDVAHERLLVSSTDRRKHEADGQIYSVDPVTLTAKRLQRRGEPMGMPFNPHGLSYVQTSAGPLLYAITHSDPLGEGPHAILVYVVEAEYLSFLELLQDPLLTSPNDLAALPDGSVYVCNDQSANGGFNEVALALKKATIVHFRPQQGWRVVADQLAYPNGIVVTDDRVIAAATREHRLYHWDRDAEGALSGRRVLAEVKGPDNLEWYGDRIVVAGHVSDLAFLRHFRKGTPAPTFVQAVDLETGELEVIFGDDGSRIPGGSVAVPVDGTFWIGQVFDPWILAFRPPEAG